MPDELYWLVSGARILVPIHCCDALVHVVEDVFEVNPPSRGGGATQSAGFVAAVRGGGGGYFRTVEHFTGLTVRKRRF